MTSAAHRHLSHYTKLKICFPVDRRAEDGRMDMTLEVDLECIAEQLGLLSVRVAQHLWLKSMNFNSGRDTAKRY